MDKDRNGKISRFEFKSCLDLIHAGLTVTEQDMVFDYLDINNNGSIEKEEFKIFDKEQIGRGP